MILAILVGLQTMAIFVGIPLLLRYSDERVKNLAREATEKSLADYQHRYDRVLAELSAGHQRRVHEFGLFAQRRNEIYAETYSLFEKARGGFAQHFATLTQTRDFSRSPEPDLRHLAKKLDAISEGERATLIGALDRGDLPSARRTANQLFERDSLRSSNRAFYEFKRAWVLHALYFSPEVSDLLQEAIQPLSMLSIFADERIEEDGEEQHGVPDRRRRAELVTQTDALSPRLRAAMRAEMNPTAEPIP
jgi:hypothetical protein